MGLQETAVALIAKHRKTDDRYATYRNAEVEAWNAWYRSGSGPESRDSHFSALAHRIADIYHSHVDPVVAVPLAA